MRMPGRLLRTGLILLVCWRISSAQDSRPDLAKTAMVTSNLPLGIEFFYDLSLHRFDGLTPRAPHWRPWSIPDGSHGFDVTGNALYSYLLTRTFRYGYQYAGFSPFTATLLSGATVLLFHGFIKYRESLYYGAQRHDFVGAWSGALPLLCCRAVSRCLRRCNTSGSGTTTVSKRGLPGHFSRNTTHSVSLSL